MDMNNNTVQRLLFKATIQDACMSTRIDMLQGIIADFFRLHRISDNDALRSGLDEMSDKLLKMQEESLNERDRTATILADIKRGIAEQTKAMQTEQEDAMKAAAE